MAQQASPSPTLIAQSAIKEAFSELVATQPVVQPPQPVIAQPRLNKQEIKEEFNRTKLPAGASQDETAQFEVDKKEFGAVLGRGGDNEAALWDKLLEVRERVRLIEAGVAGRKAAKAEIEREFKALDFTTINAAPENEKQPVNELAAKMGELLKPDDAYNRLDDLRDKFNQTQKQFAAVRDNIQRRTKEKAEIEKQLAALPWPSIAAALDEERKPLKTLNDEAAEKLLLDPLTNEAVARALAIASDLARQVDELAQKVEQRLARKREIEEAGRAVTLPPEAVSSLLDAARNQLSDVLKKPLSDPVLVEAQQALDSLNLEADRVRAETEKQIVRREMYRKQLQGALQVFDNANVKGPEINAKVDSANALLDEVPITRLDEFPEALKAVRRAAHGVAQKSAQKGGGAGYISAELGAIRNEIEALGSGLSGQKKKGLVEKADEIQKSMGQKLNATKVQRNLKDVRELRESLEKVRAEIGVAMEEMAGQREFINSEIQTPDPDGVDASYALKLENQREAVRKLLVDPLTRSNLDQAAVQTKAFHALRARAEQDVIDGNAVAKQLSEIPALYGPIHPASRKPVQAELAALWQTGQTLAAAKGDARDMKAALLALEKLRSRLAEVESENQKAAASKAQLKQAKADGNTISSEDADEIYDAFGPDAIDGLKAGLGDLDQVAALCKTFKTGKGGVAALGTLTREGLGSAETLVALYKDGCGGDAAKLQQFEAAFGSDEDRANLRGMADTALGKDARLLTSALQTGCGLDTLPVSKRKDFATAAADLKTFCAAFKDEKDQRKLNSLLQKGGIGANPKVFGSILKIGCEGDPKKGEDSMDYRAGQLKKLAGAYTNPVDQQRLKGMMDQGGLGHQNCPEVLAYVLKKGCDGDPAKLKNLGNAFKTDEDLGKLNDLIMHGGFGGTPPDDRQDTLGKVLEKGLRYEDTPDKDEPQRLKNLHAAFAGNNGADLAQLKEIVDSFNDDLRPVYTSPPPAVGPRDEPVPGERFANLLNKKNMNGNIAKLKTMYDQLRAQSQQVGTVGINPPTPVPRSVKPLKDLIRNAATIKKANITGAQPARLGQGNCANVKSARMGHFCRHTRDHTQFELASKAIVTADLNSADQPTRDRGKRKAKTTTLWPENITDKEIASYVDLALATLGANVPRNATLADGDFVPFDNVAIPSNPAFTITIGFERKGSNIEITQFFPTGGPGLEAIAFYDMHSIKEGIQ
jgi:hypothetical protein